MLVCFKSEKYVSRAFLVVCNFEIQLSQEVLEVLHWVIQTGCPLFHGFRTTIVRESHLIFPVKKQYILHILLIQSNLLRFKVRILGHLQSRIIIN